MYPSLEKYQRQLILPGWGVTGQKKLAALKPLVVGAGGLGCPVLLHLCAAGVKIIGIMDSDKVTLSNLHRQWLFGLEDVGKYKVHAAAMRLAQQFPECSVQPYAEALHEGNAPIILSKYDVVIDATDSLETRYLIDTWCRKMHKPWIYGAIFQYEGQISIFNRIWNGKYSVCYSDIFPQSNKMQIATCDAYGAVSTVTTLVGSIMAHETIKLCIMPEYALFNQLIYINLLTGLSQVFELNEPTSVVSNNELSHRKDSFIPFEAAQNLQDSLIIDVRSSHESPPLPQNVHFIRWAFQDICVLSQPFQISESISNVIERYTQWVLICSAGKRAAAAADILCKLFPEKKIYHSKIPQSV